MRFCLSLCGYLFAHNNCFPVGSLFKEAALLSHTDKARRVRPGFTITIVMAKEERRLREKATTSYKQEILMQFKCLRETIFE